jgi:hypothetical protein
MVLGISGWLSPTGYRWLAPGFGAGMALVAVVALVTGILAPFAPPPVASPAEVAGADAVNETFGEQLELLAYRWSDADTSDLAASPRQSGEAGGTLPGEVSLILYWRALRPPEEDLRTTLRLNDAGGNPVWEWKRSPGAGRLSTDRWQTDRVVRDVYRIPAGALSQAGRIELGLRPFPDGDWLLPAPGSDAQPLFRMPGPTP